MGACPALEFKQPEERTTKSAHFHVLLREGENIALTHSLYGEAGFVECNKRATNKYKDRCYLAYLINLHTDPTIDEWFNEHGKVVNKDAIALASMLQWIWRSAIRNGERIRLYIPSWRMRKMLEGWLAGLPAGQIACTDDEEKERKMRIFTHRIVKREKGKKKAQIKKNSA